MRGVSDHSPLLVSLVAKPGTDLPRPPWKLNAFLLKLFPSHEWITAEISGFWQRHEDYPDPRLTWEAFKAFLGGILITEVTGIKTKTNAIKDQTEQMVSRLEAEFIAHPSDAAREAWMAAPEPVDRITGEAADRKRFFNKQSFYEEGEETGRLLTKIVKASQTSPSIGALRPEGGGTGKHPHPHYGGAGKVLF